MDRTGETERCSFGTKNTTLFWSHGVRLLEQLNAQRNFETFCDVVVHVGDNGSFSAHRCILAASSAKLYTLMFSTSNDCTRSVHLDGITVSGFKIVLEFIYTGILNFDGDTVKDVISAATYLEMPAVVRLCEEYANVNSVAEVDSDVKTEESIGSQFHPALAGSLPCSSSERSGHSLIAAVNPPAWANRFLPSSVEEALFDTSFSQYYSSCNEPAFISNQQNCDEIHDTMQQQTQSLSLVPPVADTMHKRHQTSYNGDMPGRNCTTSQYQELSDEDNDVGSPICEAASILEKEIENYDTLQLRSRCHSEPSKHGVRKKAKRRRKTEAPSKTKTDSSIDITPVTTGSGSNKQKPLRVKMRKKKNDKVTEKNSEVAEGSESDTKAAGSANEDVIHMCDECGKEFPSTNVLTRHKRTHSSRIFHCKVCLADFAEPVAFKRHSVVMHEIQRPFTCSHPDCNYRSDRLSNVEKHMSIHSPTHAFACSLCGRTFAQDAGLRSHLLSCMSSRSFLCDLCGSSFNHLQSMQSHQRVHTGERPYRCTECDSTFADHRNYKRHRRIHDNAFPYACMLCGKRFRHSNSLKSHLGSHGIMTKPVEVSTPLQTSQTSSLGIFTKPVDSTVTTPTHPGHSLAHTAF